MQMILTIGLILALPILVALFLFMWCVNHECGGVAKKLQAMRGVLEKIVRATIKG